MPGSTNDHPIGVFDSGVGGLTVAAALRRHLPAENILYLGDTARLPYGSKSGQTVRRYAARNLEFLTGRGAKAVVVACNTASALALPQPQFEVPIWGVIEAGAASAAAVAKRRVGVIATESTVRSGAYAKALVRHRPELEIESKACPLFVPLVEEGWYDDSITEQIARRYLESLLDRQIDTLVLGCTHYPLLRPVLRKVVGEGVELVDSAETVAAQVAAELRQAGLALEDERTHRQGSLSLCATDASEPFRKLAGELLGQTVSLEWVEV